jgi:hypothetical protein
LVAQSSLEHPQCSPASYGDQRVSGEEDLQGSGSSRAVTESFTSRSFSVHNLQVSHWVMTIFLIINFGLGGYLFLQTNSRVRFSETTDLVLLGIMISLSLTGMISNGVFVIGQCFALRKRGVSLTWSHQGLIFLALVPGFGWRFFDRLASNKDPVSHRMIGSDESTSLPMSQSQPDRN